MNFIERTIGMVIKPEETIKDILKEPRIEEALVIIGIYTLILVITAFVNSRHLIQGDASTGLVTSLITLGGALIVPPICWLIATGVVHLISIVLGGKGKLYPNMVTAIGFTYVLKVPFILIAMILIALTPVIVVPVVPAGTQDLTALKPMADAMVSFYMNPFYLGSVIVVYIGLIWSCYTGMLAVKNGESLSMKEAIIAVGVPMAIYIVMSVILVAFTIISFQYLANVS